MKLTPEQTAVVELAAGRHLVLAPPGSGKTEMLSQRILRALGAGVPPEKMLCATFTNRAAFEMRDRVSSAGEDLLLPDVGNLHHFCHSFLRSVQKIHPGKHVLDEIGQLGFIREVVHVLREELKTGMTADLKRTHGVAVMGSIKGICEPMRIRLHEELEGLVAKYEEKGKSLHADILSAALIVHQRRLGIPSCYLRAVPPSLYGLVADDVIGAIERSYTGLKRKFQTVDFDDLINETYLFLSKNPIPDDRRYSWVQIDEVQDLNPLQWRIVKELTASNAVSVYFGDAEQSIFSFLGASAGCLDEQIADCARHYFKTNFRAMPILLEILMRFSLGALKSDWEFLPHPADVHRPNGEVTVSSSVLTEDVIARVGELLESGKAENVAILVRENAAADSLEKKVKDLGYRSVKVSGMDLFSYAPMRDFLSFVSLLTEKPSMTSWAALFRRFAKGILSGTTARYFIRSMFASGWDPRCIFEKKSPVLEFPKKNTRRAFWAWSHRRALSSFRKTLKPVFDELRLHLDAQVDFRRLFRVFADLALGETRRYSNKELVPGRISKAACDAIPYEEARMKAVERIEIFLRYADAIYKKDSRTLAQVLLEDWDRLSKLKEADLLVGDEKIVISTIHKAKGRQFDAVVVPSVTSVVSSVGAADADEALRLLYVAMSRAKRHLSLFGCGMAEIAAELNRCCNPDYVSYYLRKAKGEDVSGDWLNEWEILAAYNARRECPREWVDRGLSSSSKAVQRMALKVLRHSPDAEYVRKIYLERLRTVEGGVVIHCLDDMKWYDQEILSLIRRTALLTEGDIADGADIRRAAFAFFRSVLRKSASEEARAFAIDALGDFIYDSCGGRRLAAAFALKDLGIDRWEGLIRGSSTDFDRLAAVPDAEHESSIREILEQNIAEGYKTSLRQILFRRARAER